MWVHHRVCVHSVVLELTRDLSVVGGSKWQPAIYPLSLPWTSSLFTFECITLSHVPLKLPDDVSALGSRVR